MKPNFWLLAEKLAGFHPDCHIDDGRTALDGLRLLSDLPDDTPDSRFVYLYDTPKDNAEANTITLINGADTLTIRGQSLQTVVNAVLSAFDFYSAWEDALWDAAGDVQAVLDTAFLAMKAPMILADIDGTVLAMTTEGDDNPYWASCQETGTIPIEILGAPGYDEAGQISRWRDTPAMYYLANHTKIMSVLLTADGETLAALCAWEHETPLTPGHLALMATVEQVFLSMQRHDTLDLVHTGAAILKALLSGQTVTDADKIAKQIPAPWVLMLVDNPYQQNIAFSKSIVRQIRQTKTACVPMVYADRVVCLLSEQDADRALAAAHGHQQNKYTCVVTSVPFDKLSDAKARYDGACFSLKQNAGVSGMLNAADDAFAYLLSRLRAPGDYKALVHPALSTLKRYDQKHDGALYDSLYYYLLYGQSVQQGAAAVHVHRNSFLYRIHRIIDLTGIDLDNPMTRAYLLVSYFLEKA